MLPGTSARQLGYEELQHLGFMSLVVYNNNLSYVLSLFYHTKLKEKSA
jgi:hypothetical protein